MSEQPISIGQRERRERFIELWPKYGFKVAPAAVAAGYSESYARTSLAKQLRKDVSFSERMDRVRAQNMSLAEDKIKALDTRLDNLIDTGDLNNTQMLKAIELRYRRLGALQDKTVVESVERQKELTDSQREHARKVATYLMEQHSKGA